MNSYEQRIVADVGNYGWHVMGVAPAADRDDPEEWFAYTIGLSKTFGWPELICFGLGTDVMATLLNDAVEECRSTGIEPSADLLLNEVIGGFPAKLVRNDAIPPQYVTSARWFARHEGLPSPSMLQLLWPDSNGIFPDEPGCSDGVRKSQTPVETA